MCTQRNMILTLNMATGQSGRKAENYIPFFYFKSLLEQKVVIIILHTYTAYYIQETSKYFTNYSLYPQGSQFLGKEVTSDENLVPNGRPFQSQLNGVEWEGEEFLHFPTASSARGLLQHPFLSHPLPTCMCSLGIRVN